MHRPSELLSVYLSFCPSLLFFPFRCLSLFSLSLYSSFPLTSAFFLSLLPWFLSVLISFSGCLYVPVQSSICPSSVSHSLLRSLTLPPLLLTHIFPPLPFYLSISLLNSWFKDCFTHLKREGAGIHWSLDGFQRCLWSKALSAVKAHPSVIHSLLQSLENSQCGYSA